MSQRVSPLLTCTMRVGSGVPGRWVATEPAAVTKTPTAKATSRAATTTTTRPRRVSRTVDLDLADRGRRRSEPNIVSRVIVVIWTPGEGGLAGLGLGGSSCRDRHRQWRAFDQTFDRTCVRR